MRPLADKILKILPNRNEDPEKRYFKSIILLAVGIVLLMVVAGLVVFFLTVQSEEQTMVPNLEGLELENALLSLESRALYPSIQLRYSQNPLDKGTIIGQEPIGGTNVKAGSRVLLRVSRGSAVETLDDYVGWDLDDLEAHLRSMVTIYGPLLSIQKPVMSVFHDSSAGTILEQKPLPGTELSQHTELELVVSRGPQGQTTTVLDYVGLPYQDVLASVVRQNIPFVFTSQTAGRTQTPGTVVSQSPPSGQNVPAGTITQFVIAEPRTTPDGSIFGIFERTLPQYDVPVRIIAEAVSPMGAVKQLFTMRHPGGLVTVPYMEPEDTQIRLIVGDQVPITFTVRADRN